MITLILTPVRLEAARKAAARARVAEVWRGALRALMRIIGGA